MTNSNTDSRIIFAASHDAADMLDRLTRCDCPDTLPRIRNCIHFDASTALRALLIDRDTSPTIDDDPLISDDPALFDFMRALLARIDANPYSTETLTKLALDHSLCPMHFCDYAICFDDDDAECAQIRAIHPSHDT